MSYANVSDTLWINGTITTCTLGSISGYVWFDANGDAIMDAEEIGIKEYIVTLYDSLGQTVGENTDNTGYYGFSGLPPDSYSLEIIVIDPYHPTTSITIPVTLGLGEAITDQNFGLNIDPNDITPGGDCRSPGFRKTNLRKLLGHQHGTPQVSEENMIEYCNTVYTLFYDGVFGSTDPATGGDGLSLQEALDIILSGEASGAPMADKLRRQLMAGELDYVSDDYQADDNGLFGNIIWYCEYILTNGITGEYETWKDVLDSYWV
ncbi:hypothetical protein KA005_83960 [bacterium]|nr:hypothetical protein [bacterium]